MSTLRLEEIDLATLTRDLKATVGLAVPGRMAGRTAYRDGVVSICACSALEAEYLVDTLVVRGFLREEQPSATSPGGVRIA